MWQYKYQSAQAAFTVGRQPFSAGVVRVHLGHQKHPLALTDDGLADHFFSPAIAVHFRRVDERHAQVDAKAQRGNLFFGPAFTFAHLPGALSEHGHGCSVWQGDRFHGCDAESANTQRCAVSTDRTDHLRHGRMMLPVQRIRSGTRAHALSNCDTLLC